MPADWYEKHKSEVTAALTRGRHAAQENAVPCTLVKLHDGGYCLCAAVTAPKEAAMVKEAKAQGGKVVSSGSLYNGEDGVIFAVTQGSASVKKQFSDGAQAATGKAMSVTVLAVEAAPAAEPAPAAAPATTDPATAAFKARLNDLVGAVKQAAPALQAQFQPLLVQAVKLGKEAHFAEAAPLLDQVAKGLAAAPPGAPKAPSLVDLQKMRLAWARTRDALKADLEKLEQAILAASKDQDEFDPADVAAGVKNLFVVLEELDARLLDKLDDALNAADADRRARLQRQAKAIIADYLDFIHTDPMMAVIDDHNGFTPVSVRKSAVGVLTALAGKL